LWLCFFFHFLSFFFFCFPLTLYFWNSKLYSRFLIFAFWYLLSILYLYFLYNFCDFVFFFLSFFFFFFSLTLYFWNSKLYSRFLIFDFGIWYQCCTFKNPIFSTHFYLGPRLLAWLLSPPLDSPFSPLGRLYLLPNPSLLYPTLWFSLCSRW